MRLDIIIPAYQNEQQIGPTIQALCQQRPPNWHGKVIIVDDGSTDATKERAHSASKSCSFEIEIVSQHHQGVSRARNHGISRSNADVVLLLGADIMLRPGVLQQHIEFHRHHRDAQEAALGMVRWDPRLPPSPLMEWMMHGGQQNNFDAILGKQHANPEGSFYASHVSLKREVVQSHQFPTQITGYGWEDLLLGKKLKSQVKLRLTVLHDAIGLHNHYYSAMDISERQRAVGENSHHLASGDQVAVGIPHRPIWKQALTKMTVRFKGAQALAHLALRIGEKSSYPHLFLRATTLFFWQGVYNSKAVSRKIRAK